MTTQQFPEDSFTPIPDPTQPIPQNQYAGFQPPISPEPNKDQPWYKKWWTWVIVVLLLVIVGLGLGLAGGANDDETPSAASSSPTAAATTLDAEAQASASAAAQAEAEASAAAQAEAEASAAAQAEAEASASAAAKAARLDPSTYSAISQRDWQLIEKDPDSHTGEKYVVYGYVTQADAATGTESFLTNTGGEQTDWYDYDINTMVSADSSIVASVVADDIVQMYVEILGSYSYDTQIGGNTTAVLVQANIVNNLGTTD